MGKKRNNNNKRTSRRILRIVEATLVSCLTVEKVLSYKELDSKCVTEKKNHEPMMNLSIRIWF